MAEETDEVISTDITSKPRIKKRVLKSDSDSDDNDAFLEYSYNGKSSSKHVSLGETEAHRDLFDYLVNKGIDVSTREVQGYKAHVKYPHQDRHNDNSTGSAVITYSCANGDKYLSKDAVLNAIKSSKNKSQSSHSPKSGSLKANIFASAKKRFNAFMRDGLPGSFDGIKVISFGSIDPDNNSFHTFVEIYPVGYKVEMTVSIEERGHSAQSTRVLCEIGVRSTLPDFRITTISTGHTVSAASEVSAWKKVKQIRLLITSKL
jgi:hypothetical protein